MSEDGEMTSCLDFSSIFAMFDGSGMVVVWVFLRCLWLFLCCFGGFLSHLCAFFLYWWQLVGCVLVGRGVFLLGCLSWYCDLFSLFSYFSLSELSYCFL